MVKTGGIEQTKRTNENTITVHTQPSNKQQTIHNQHPQSTINNAIREQRQRAATSTASALATAPQHQYARSCRRTFIDAHGKRQNRMESNRVIDRSTMQHIRIDVIVKPRRAARQTRRRRPRTCRARRLLPSDHLHRHTVTSARVRPVTLQHRTIGTVFSSCASSDRAIRNGKL